jgi:hypothetical protein
MLRRATCQAHGSLVDFYSALAAAPDSVSATIGRGMLELLPLLPKVLGSRPVWGLTSLSALWLLPSDDYMAVWAVGIQAVPGEGYRIQYLLPSISAPWPNACVQGLALDAATAAAFVEIAIRESKAWDV